MAGEKEKKKKKKMCVCFFCFRQRRLKGGKFAKKKKKKKTKMTLTLLHKGGSDFPKRSFANCDSGGRSAFPEKKPPFFPLPTRCLEECFFFQRAVVVRFWGPAGEQRI